MQSRGRARTQRMILPGPAHAQRQVPDRPSRVATVRVLPRGRRRQLAPRTDALTFSEWPHSAGTARLAQRASRQMSLEILRLFWRAIAQLRKRPVPAAFVAGQPVERERAIAMAVCVE